MMDAERPAFDMDSVVSEVERRLSTYDDSLEVSVLSTAVYGVDEARDADFGITGARTQGSSLPRASR